MHPQNPSTHKMKRRWKSGMNPNPIFAVYIPTPHSQNGPRRVTVCGDFITNYTDSLQGISLESFWIENRRLDDTKKPSVSPIQPIRSPQWVNNHSAIMFLTTTSVMGFLIRECILPHNLHHRISIWNKKGAYQYICSCIKWLGKPKVRISWMNI